ncbi:MAG: hypothetical protein ACREXT_20330 [Gammaproteobacteria bacterium]
MKRLNIFLALLIVAACSTTVASDRQQLAAAEIAFTNTLEEIAVARSAGALSQSDVDRLKTNVDAARAALDMAHGVTSAGQPARGAIEAAQQAVRALIRARQGGGT